MKGSLWINKYGVVLYIIEYLTWKCKWSVSSGSKVFLLWRFKA